MDERSEPWAGDAAVLATRREILEDRFATWLRALPDAPIVTTWDDGTQRYQAHTAARLRSGLLWVAQYWADNADDEVHLRLSASSRDVPEWPHVCARHEHGATEVEACYQCTATSVPNTHDWGYNQLIPAFEAFCHEGSNQEQPDIESHRPFALAHLVDGAVEVEIIGPLVRPWLDMPREHAAGPPLPDRLVHLIEASRENPAALSVLGDALLERGDPRGELVALGDGANAHARRRELLDGGVGRLWLGSIAPHVPRSAVRYRGGIPVEIGLWIEPGLAAALDREDPLPWALGPRVRFLPTSMRPIWRGLSPVRALGPLDSVGLEELAATGIPFELEELELELFDVEHDLARLFAVDTQLPHLRRLRLTGLAATPEELVPRLRGWSRTAELSLIDIAGVRSPDVHVEELVAWRAARLSCPVAVTMYDAEAKCASGWSITVGGVDIVVERVGYLLEATPELLARLVAALPRERFERRASPFWSP